MRVLNLDLDFFLSDAVYHRADDVNARPDDEDIEPWEADEVISLLRDSLYLRTRSPFRLVTHHDEVFFIWRELVQRNELTSPFFVCHVDAHSDLCMGSPACVYLHSDFLELPLTQRQYPTEGEEGINFANYMSFVIGNRWISEIDFIVPSFWSADIPWWQLTDDSDNCIDKELMLGTQMQIELMHAPREKIMSCHDFSKIRKPVGEPRVPLNIISHQSLSNRYQDVHWDFVFLSQSPGYVPRTGDALIPVIESYIAELPDK
jgi:hypothetical protein